MTNADKFVNNNMAEATSFWKNMPIITLKKNPSRISTEARHKQDENPNGTRAVSFELFCSCSCSYYYCCSYSVPRLNQSFGYIEAGLKLHEHRLCESRTPSMNSFARRVFIAKFERIYECLLRREKSTIQHSCGKLKLIDEPQLKYIMARWRRTKTSWEGWFQPFHTQMIQMGQRDTNVMSAVPFLTTILISFSTCACMTSTKTGFATNVSGAMILEHRTRWERYPLNHMSVSFARTHSYRRRICWATSWHSIHPHKIHLWLKYPKDFSLMTGLRHTQATTCSRATYETTPIY